MMLYVSFFDVRRIARDAKAEEPAAKKAEPDAPSDPAAQPESLPAVVPVK
jgi:hypothetical protein